MSRRKIAELDTPYSSVEWPSIAQEDQDAILELLCTLLEPLGQHRRGFVVPSRGKRRRKRQLSGETAGAQAGTEAADTVKVKSDSVPPPPELARFVDVGLASVSRELARCAGATDADLRKTPPSHAPSSTSAPPPASPVSPASPPPYAAIFVARSAHPSAFYSHFPQMVAVASQSPQPSSESPIRLVGFSRACEERLSASIGIPRVSSIALRDGAPHSQGLLAFVRDKVAPVDVPWLDEARAGQFRETQIRVTDVAVGPKKKVQKTNA